MRNSQIAAYPARKVPAATLRTAYRAGDPCQNACIDGIVGSCLDSCRDRCEDDADALCVCQAACWNAKCAKLQGRCTEGGDHAAEYELCCLNDCSDEVDCEVTTTTTTTTTATTTSTTSTTTTTTISP